MIDVNIQRRFEGWWQPCLKREGVYFPVKRKAFLGKCTFQYSFSILFGSSFWAKLMLLDILRQKRFLEKQVDWLMR